MYKLFLIALCVALWQSAIAQNSYSLIGSRGNGTGYTTACMDDGWSIFNNPGGLAGIGQTQTAITCDIVPGFSTFNRMAALIAIPAKLGTFGGGVFRFGDDLYSETSVSLGFANQLGLASLGGKVQYMQYRVEGFGQKSVLTFSAGGIAKITPWLRAGAHIINIIQPDITPEEKVPAFLIAGVSLKASKLADVYAEIEKDIDHIPVFKAGLEYQLHQKFIARSGFNVNPAAMFFGFGFRPKNFHLDYAFSYLPHAVSRQQLSVCYLLRESK